MNVLIACEYSATVRDAFRRRGHDAWSCDLLPTEGDPRYHLQGDVLQYLTNQIDLLIAHPPCTYLTNAGVRHLHPCVTGVNGKQAKIYGMDRWNAVCDGARFFLALKQAPATRVAIENPIPHRYARAIIGNYDQIIQPWQFGHGETKATCLWLKNLPLLVPTRVVEGREARVHRMPPSKDRAKERSRTYQGIADAMAAQWG